MSQVDLENINWFIDKTGDNSIIFREEVQSPTLRYFNSHIDEFEEYEQNYYYDINNYSDYIPFIQIKKTIPIIVKEFDVFDEDKECCICMEKNDNENIGRLKCDHSFCIKCINQHLKKNNCCPICRSEISGIQVQNQNAHNDINFN
jgi:hypothetical protein